MSANPKFLDAELAPFRLLINGRLVPGASAFVITARYPPARSWSISCSTSGIEGAPRYWKATEATSARPCQAATRATPPRKRMDCVFTAGERTP